MAGGRKQHLSARPVSVSCPQLRTSDGTVLARNTVRSNGGHRPTCLSVCVIFAFHYVMRSLQTWAVRAPSTPFVSFPFGLAGSRHRSRRLHARRLPPHSQLPMCGIAAHSSVRSTPLEPTSAPFASGTADREDLLSCGQEGDSRGSWPRSRRRKDEPMTNGRTDLGREVEAALGEVLRPETLRCDVRGETSLPCRIVDDPAAERIVALRKRMKLSRQRFADRFGLDAAGRCRTGNPGQGRRVPDRAARVLLTVIDRDPEAVRASSR